MRIRRHVDPINLKIIMWLYSLIKLSLQRQFMGKTGVATLFLHDVSTVVNQEAIFEYALCNDMLTRIGLISRRLFDRL